MVTLKELIHFLNTLAPASLQEDYDNAGLITGNPSWEIKGILLSLDCTENIIEEAIERGCNVVVAHHPIIFKGLKRLNGNNYVERTVIKAIKNDIAIFAIHTNLDNVLDGVNGKIAKKLDLRGCKILLPKQQTLRKISFFEQADNVEKVCEAMHKAGAGQIGNYKDCSFRIEGVGTFTPGEGTNPTVGSLGLKSYEKEVRVEMIYPFYAESDILKAMRKAHSYEEVAYYIHILQNENQEVGSGIVGELPIEMGIHEFFDYLKEKMELQIIKHTALVKDRVKKVALCGGAGSFLTKNAISHGADVYISADYKYHEFFDAEGKIIILDIGHYESEKYTIDLLFDLISNKFSTFAIHYTNQNTNPVNFY